MTSATSRTRALALAGLALSLCGCFEEKSHQPAQPPAAREEVTGIVTDGTASLQFVAGKGTEGIPRQATAHSDRYALSLVQLTGPYLLSNTLTPNADPDKVLLTAVATHPGVVNLTPFTTLLTAQVLGVSPANAVSSFNSSSTPSALITDAAIEAAQRDLAGFLKDVYNLDVGTARFIDAPFTAAAGDPMFDAITALNARLSAGGKRLSNLAATIAIGAQACQNGVVHLTFTGAERNFCAARRSAVPDDTDATILEYLFRNAAGEELTLRARNTTVLAAQLHRADGTMYACATIACTGFLLEAPDVDESRFINFANVSLAAASGNVVLTGRLHGAIPGAALPPLPCTANRFYMVFDDRSVVGDCVSVSNPFNLSGNFGSDLAPNRSRWSLANTGPDSLASAPSVDVMLDTSGAEPTVASIYYSDNDPETGAHRYLCQLAACNGISFGTPVTATYFGVPVTTRDINFNATPLAGLAEDGTSIDLSGDLTGTFTLLLTPNTSTWPTADPCDPSTTTVAEQVAGTHFNVCVMKDPAYTFVYVNDNGDESTTTQIYAMDASGSNGIQVTLNYLGALTEVYAWVGGANFYCRGNCTGVSVSAPDGDGTRTLSLANTVLFQQENYPAPSDQTLKLNATNIVAPLYQ